MQYIITCPYCNGIMKAEEEWIGLKAPCPFCGKEITIAKPSSTPVSAPQQVQSPKQNKGLKLVFAISLVLAILCIFLTLAIAAAVFLPTLNHINNDNKKIVCIQNLKQLSLGMIMYAQDHDDYFPPSLEVLDAEGYVLSDEKHNIFICPISSEKYILRDEIKGVKTTEIEAPDTTPMIECQTPHGKNKIGKHVAYVDGHVSLTMPLPGQQNQDIPAKNVSW